MPDNAIRYCYRRRLGRLVDGVSFGLEEAHRQHAEPGLGHRNGETLVGIRPEDDGVIGPVAENGDRGAVDLCALVVAMKQRALVLDETVRIDLDQVAVDRDGDQFGAVVTLLVHELSCLIVKDRCVCPEKGAKRKIGPGGSTPEMLHPP